MVRIIYLTFKLDKSMFPTSHRYSGKSLDGEQTGQKQKAKAKAKNNPNFCMFWIGQEKQQFR